MLFKRTPKTRFIFFLISDIFLISASVAASFFLRYEFSIPYQYKPLIAPYAIIAILVLIPIFISKKMYHFTWAYVSIANFVNIFKAVSYGFLIIGMLLFLGRNHLLAQNLPRSIILLDYFLTFALVGGLRISKRLYGEIFANRTKSSKKNKEKPKILIIGAGDAGEQLVRSIKQTPDYPFQLSGILDDSDIKQGTAIHDVRILGKINDLARINKNLNIYGIIIAIANASPVQIKHIVQEAQSCGILYIKTIPSLLDLMKSRVSLNDVRDIAVEDLLGREKIDISISEISELIHKKSVLITGAAGSIGFELVKQISKFIPENLICLDMDETGIFTVRKYLVQTLPRIEFSTPIANILNKDKINRIFERYKPQIVFHAAAYKHVHLMETSPDEAVLNNLLGTWNIAEAARQNNAEKFILISTDKAVHPTSIMGMTKRAAEILVMHYNNRETSCSAVRFGNVLGSRGSVVPLFKEQIRSGGPVTITHPDMQRYFMIPSEAILLVLQAAQIGAGGEIFVLDMGKPVKILDLAESMIRLAGFKPHTDIPIVFTNPGQGEKLFEELLTNIETMNATKHSSIFIARESIGGDKRSFFENIETLVEMAKKGEIEGTGQLLAEIAGVK